MSNAITKIEHGAETVGKDALKVVEVVGRAGADLTRVLATAKTLSPAFKAELAKLIADAEPIAAELAPLLATPGYADIGLSIAAIAPVASDVYKLAADFITFMPTLKLAIVDVESDVK